MHNGATVARIRTLNPQSLTRHTDRLYRAAWALCGSREDAEDLVQDTFARVLSKPRLLSGDDELAYLMRVLRNTFFTGRRTASRRPVTAATLDDVAAVDGRPTSQPEQALDAQELYAAIASLPEDFRLALVAVDVLGLSYREAAHALRTREATIATRLFRARGQVVRQMDAESPEAQVSLPEDGRAAKEERDHDGRTVPRAQDGEKEPSRERSRDPSPPREGTTPRERLAEQGYL
ncbi:MAG TPA: RNA polymerase sigma factor [Solirubrobacteraceae bacterium]|nr:RNA polymerase sigma factor [Solirubrobacteraceae bacterium]